MEWSSFRVMVDHSLSKEIHLYTTTDVLVSCAFIGIWEESSDLPSIYHHWCVGKIDFHRHLRRIQWLTHLYTTTDVLVSCAFIGIWEESSDLHLYTTTDVLASCAVIGIWENPVTYPSIYYHWCVGELCFHRHLRRIQWLTIYIYHWCVGELCFHRHLRRNQWLTHLYTTTDVLVSCAFIGIWENSETFLLSGHAGGCDERWRWKVPTKSWFSARNCFQTVGSISKSPLT